VGEVDAARGGEAFDMLLGIVIADELRTGLSTRPFGDDEADWKMRAEVWRNRDAVIGGSDAGAHLDMMCGTIYTTALLGHGVRGHQVVTLEEAVRLITDVPARQYGVTERGRITQDGASVRERELPVGRKATTVSGAGCRGVIGC
jgi:N-acyl-D-aspartate/D-glutamate deacylase